MYLDQSCCYMIAAFPFAPEAMRGAQFARAAFQAAKLVFELKTFVGHFWTKNLAAPLVCKA